MKMILILLKIVNNQYMSNLEFFFLFIRYHSLSLLICCVCIPLVFFKLCKLFYSIFHCSFLLFVSCPVFVFQFGLFLFSILSLVCSRLVDLLLCFFFFYTTKQTQNSFSLCCYLMNLLNSLFYQ
jgi:hypothetical protein